ncbi:hypothetical protein CLF_108955, partial [Clonorchis sinensis]
MEQVVRAQRFNMDWNSPDSVDIWSFCRRTFENYLEEVNSANHYKLEMSHNFVSPVIIKFAASCYNYDTSTTIHKAVCIQPKNEVC